MTGEEKTFQQNEQYTRRERHVFRMAKAKATHRVLGDEAPNLTLVLLGTMLGTLFHLGLTPLRGHSAEFTGAT